MGAEYERWLLAKGAVFAPSAAAVAALVDKLRKAKWIPEAPGQAVRTVDNEYGTDAAKKTALRDLSRWMLTAGQKQCQEFGYSPLPPEFANRELQALSALN